MRIVDKYTKIYKCGMSWDGQENLRYTFASSCSRDHSGDNSLVYINGGGEQEINKIASHDKIVCQAMVNNSGQDKIGWSMVVSD